MPGLDGLDERLLPSSASTQIKQSQKNAMTGLKLSATGVRNTQTRRINPTSSGCQAHNGSRPRRSRPEVRQRDWCCRTRQGENQNLAHPPTGITPMRLVDRLLLAVSLTVPLVVPCPALADGGTRKATSCSIESGSIGIDGGNLPYRAAGSGPVVLLLHGLFAQKEQWDAFLCRLAADGRRGIAPDLPGYGASEGFTLADYRLEAQADLLHRLAVAMKIETLDLAGNSMGGTIAAIYAVRHPDGVRSLALIGPPLGATDWAVGVKTAIIDGINPFIPLDTDQFTLELKLLFAHPPTVPDTIESAAVADYVARNRHYRQVWDIVNLYDRALVDQPVPAVPTLILWGEEDGIFSIEDASRIQTRFPGSHLVRLPDTGHLPMLESPDESAGPYLEFIQHL